MSIETQNISTRFNLREELSANSVIIQLAEHLRRAASEADLGGPTHGRDQIMPAYGEDLLVRIGADVGPESSARPANYVGNVVWGGRLFTAGVVAVEGSTRSHPDEICVGEVLPASGEDTLVPDAAWGT